MSSYTPYVAHVRKVTARLRARMHHQSFTDTIRASAEANRLDLSRVADAHLRELATLRENHRRTFDPLFKQKALNLLQTLPLKPVADDPHLSYTMRALRVCGYFGATQSPATFNLLNHATRHTFLLDAFNVHQLLSALEEMRHPQMAEILSIVLPRVMEVATDCTEGEARLLLHAYFKHHLLTMELSEKLVGVISGSVNDVSLKDLVSVVSAIRDMGSEQIARRFVEAATPRLCRALHETTEQVYLYKTTYLQPAGGGNAASATARSTLIGDTEGEQPPNPAMETPTERTLRRRKEGEWRRFLVTQIDDGLSLLRALQKSIAWLCWAPRPLLNEVVRCSLLWSEPLLVCSLDEPLPAIKWEATDAAASFGRMSSNSESAAFMEEHEKYARELPRLRRRSLCYCMKMLHCTSYRHLPAIRLLSARIAATKDVVDNSVPPLVLARELSQAVEAIAFFYATDCAPAMTEIVNEILEYAKPLMNAPAQRGRFQALSAEEVRMAERVVLRVLLSCARVLSTHADTKAEKSAPTTAPVEEGAMRALLCQATTLAISPIIQAYMGVGLRLTNASRAQIVEGANQVQNLVGTMHLAYATAVILAVSAQVGIAPAGSHAAGHDVLRANLRRLVPWAQAMATKLASELPGEAAVEMAKTLTILKKHSEILDAPEGGTSLQGGEGKKENC
ncbi:hypothetical protein JKF63_02688 [Porcisia hertigi]|uniref:Uncharacterized protein n=1 Tax=Porcisia hertigi TaxID=2761500 RepID=A0A836L2L8_9TRYP|nr:hypothetical protein JKF63_02688 [Porcisia hertigi]